MPHRIPLQSMLDAVSTSGDDHVSDSDRPGGIAVSRHHRGGDDHPERDQQRDGSQRPPSHSECRFVEVPTPMRQGCQIGA